MSGKNEELININVILADRPYPLKIRKEEEESVRKAAKAINEQVMGFQQKYEAKDKQDYLAMCALMYAVESVKSKSATVIADAGFEDKLEEIDRVLSESLR